MLNIFKRGEQSFGEASLMKQQIIYREKIVNMIKW